jgi:hypothetical protein
MGYNTDSCSTIIAKGHTVKYLFRLEIDQTSSSPLFLRIGALTEIFGSRDRTMVLQKHLLPTGILRRRARMQKPRQLP